MKFMHFYQTAEFERIRRVLLFFCSSIKSPVKYGNKPQLPAAHMCFLSNVRCIASALTEYLYVALIPCWPSGR